MHFLLRTQEITQAQNTVCFTFSHGTQKTRDGRLSYFLTLDSLNPDDGILLVEFSNKRKGKTEFFGSRIITSLHPKVTKANLFNERF